MGTVPSGEKQQKEEASVEGGYDPAVEAMKWEHEKALREQELNVRLKELEESRETREEEKALREQEERRNRELREEEERRNRKLREEEERKDREKREEEERISREKREEALREAAVREAREKREEEKALREAAERRWREEMVLKEREIAVREQELKDRAQQWKQDRENPSALLKRYGDAIKNTLLPMSDDPVEAIQFWREVENQFHLLKVPDELKAMVVRPFLNRKARALLARMNPEEAETYTKLKDHLMREMKLTPRRYHELFKTSQKKDNETYLFG